MNLRDFLKQNTSEDKNTFGRFVRQRREQLGKTVRGMAAELGMTPVYLSDIEKGNRYAPKTYLDRMRELLGVPEEDRELFDDLASATRGFQYEDINPYLGKMPLARVALRKARDYGISEEQWRQFIDSMDAAEKDKN